MSNKGNHCYKCNHFTRYYIKGVKQFDKTQYGWCNNKRDNVNIHCDCDEFILKKQPVKATKMTLYSLNDLLTQITALRQILEETDNENQMQ